MTWPNALYVAVFLLTGFAAGATPQDAQAQALNNYLAQHGYGWTQVETTDGNSEFIQAAINGHGMRLQVDTGCYYSCLKTRTAEDLKLNVQPSKSTNTGVGGRIYGTSGSTVLSSFKIGPYEINRSNPIEVLSPGARIPGDIDGMFGLDYMVMNSVVLPVAANLLFYKPGPHASVDIAPYMTQLGFRPVRLGIDRKGGLCVDGAVEGHPLHAMVDCGAAYSTFDFDYVRPIAQGNLTVSPAKFSGVDGRNLDTYVFSPHTLTLGSETIPGDMYAAVRGLSFAKQGFNGLIGYDILGAHHAILDFGHGTMWLK